MTIFIVGEEDALGTTERPPHTYVPPGKTRRTAICSADHTSSRFGFAVVRGLIEEFRSQDDKRVFARVLPADAIAPLLALDATIVDAEQRLASLRQERRDMLAALVPRAERVRAP